jgi:GTP diphosphokinase / guanosine-3',5'-bis(diphosphate) 3'-diphosphatase
MQDSDSDAVGQGNPVLDNGRHGEVGASSDALPMLSRALRFAALKHRRQRRKDAEASPYINHPIAVLSILSEEAAVDSTHVLCAAVLHDTIEDTETSAEELEAAFGPDVLQTVLAVTDDKALPKAERKRQQILRASSASHEARLVKLADKIANLRDLADQPPHDWDAARRLAYCRWAADVIDQMRGTHAELERLFDLAHARCVAMEEKSGRP